MTATAGVKENYKNTKGTTHGNSTEAHRSPIEEARPRADGGAGGGGGGPGGGRWAPRTSPPRRTTCKQHLRRCTLMMCRLWRWTGVRCSSLFCLHYY